VTDGDPRVVATAAGLVRGVELDGLRAWRGIPYAAPPTGPLRFRPPELPGSWQGVRDAAQFAPVAWQSETVNPFTGVPARLDRDEDCLCVNVTTPAGPPSDPAGYPVLLWVHGGGYVQGTGSGEPVGDGRALARRGLVVVTFNYRLGALGFLHLADLAGEHADAGVAGFLDQVAALRWVHANIAGFGGDPRRITVYGLSAGAKSVANLLASPLAAGLIARAIASSGGAEHVASPDQAVRVRRRLLRELGVTDDDNGLLKLLGAPPADVVAAQEAIAAGAAGTWIWRPVLGGSGLPVLPIDAIAAGTGAAVPLLIGSNGNEGASYQLMDPTAAGQAPRVLAELFGPAAADSMLAAYAAARPELDETGIRVAVLGDERYGVPTQRLALAQARHAPVWRYRFDGLPPGLPAELAGGHGLDMAVWGADSLSSLARSGDAQAQLGLAMADSWSAFARGKAPAAGGLPAWDQFDGAGERTMILDAEPRMQSYPRQTEFDIWQGRTWQSGTWWQFDGL
jgi:para-nitrobenzyl esterase